MKKFICSIAVIAALIAFFYISCSSDGGDSTSSSSNGGNNSGKIYLADVRDNKGQPILSDSTMVEAGTISNGEVALALPTNIDSRFLTKINSAPAGLNVEPLGVEIWFYTDPFRILSNGKHTGDLEYAKISNGVYHRIVYWYFSKDAKINGSNGEGGGIEYKIEAKKDWNKIYFKINIEDESAYMTTDLSKVPDGLAWLVTERN